MSKAEYRDPDGNQVELQVDNYPDPMMVFDTYGATSLFTTVEDMAKWDQNFVDKKVGGEAAIAAAAAPAGSFGCSSITARAVPAALGDERCEHVLVEPAHVSRPTAPRT